MTQERYTEYLRDCEAPDEASLDAAQEELLRKIEFCVLMKEAWGDGIQEA